MVKEMIIQCSETEEPNVVLLTVTVSKEDVENYLQKVYLKTRGNYNIPGFREGKAPRRMIEKCHGSNVFLEEAVNMLIPEVLNKVRSDNTLKLLTIGEMDFLQAGNGVDLILTIKAVTEIDVLLGQYKGLPYQKKDTAVTEEEIADEIAKDLQAKKREDAVNDKIQTVTDMAVDNADMHIPEMLIDEESKQKWRAFEQTLENHGLSIEQYLESHGISEKKLRADCRRSALHDIRIRCTLTAIARKENIAVTEDEMKKEAEKISKEYGLPVEDVMGAISMDELKDGLLREKAADLIVNSAVAI